jgi:glycosyltransferase involved in cell wall biosynthesis
MRLPRILILSAYYHPFLGGVETHARALAAHLKREGFDVAVLTRRVDSRSSREETIDGVAIVRVPPPGKRSTVRKWLMVPPALAAMIRRRRTFDLIYCPGYQGIGVAAILAGRLLGRPVVLRAGNLGVLSGTNWDLLLSRWRIGPDGRLIGLMKRGVRRLYASADAFACISRDIEEEVAACGVPGHRIRYLPNSVDCRVFRPPRKEERDRIRSEEGWGRDRVVFLFVGRLSSEKGILDLLEAWGAVAAPQALLVVVGPDMAGHEMDVGPAARAFVARHALEGRVVFYGPRHDVPRLLQAADVFVQPSHYEAFGIAAVEAMATGLPVVASRVGGLRDFLRDGENGLFADPGSPADLARHLNRLLDDQPLRERLGRNARAAVERAFDDPVVLEGYTRLLIETAAAGA